MKLPQFTLVDLLWTVGLLSQSAAGIAAFTRMNGMPTSALGLLCDCALVLSCPIWFCMGVAAPFRSKMLVAIVGLLVAILVALAGVQVSH